MSICLLILIDIQMNLLAMQLLENLITDNTLGLRLVSLRCLISKLVGWCSLRLGWNVERKFRRNWVFDLLLILKAIYWFPTLLETWSYNACFLWILKRLAHFLRVRYDNLILRLRLTLEFSWSTLHSHRRVIIIIGRIVLDPSFLTLLKVLFSLFGFECD